MAQPTKKGSALPVATSSSISDSILYIQGGVNKTIHPASGGGLDADLVDGQHASALCPVGILAPYAGASAPSGWLLCDGQAISRATYADLFTAIGTTYGVGNGSTTFNVPDMREASPYGVGTYSAVTGTTHGTLTAHDAATLGEFKDDRIQGHCHTANFATSTTGGSRGQPAAQSTSSGSIDDSDTVRGEITDGAHGSPRTGDTTRGKLLGVNFIIKY